MSNIKVISSFLYKLGERSSVQGVSFIIGIILARILSPTDYGILAILLIFINIASVFVQSGMGTALVQAKFADDESNNTVFFISLLIAIIVYVLLFLSAPYISTFYKMPKLSLYLKVLALMLFPSALNTVQLAKLTKEMRFKNIMWSNLSATIVSGFLGVLSALYNYGVWSLIIQQLSYRTIVCIVMWFNVDWHPKFQFDIKKAKALYKFGWKLLVSGLLDTTYNNLQGLIIGRKFNASSLAYYNRGRQFPNLIISNINSSIGAVMLPVLSKNQDNKTYVKDMMRRSIQVSTLLIFPLMAGLAAVADPLIQLLLTDKWLESVPFLQVMCITYAFWPLHTANLQAINALGRSDIFLKLELIKKTYGLTALAIAVLCFQSVIAIPIASAITVPLGLFVNSYPNKKLLKYGYFEQIKDILPSLVFAIFMGLCVYCIKFVISTLWLLLIVQIVVGIIIYLGLCIIFKIESFNYLVNTIKGFKKSK